MKTVIRPLSGVALALALLSGLASWFEPAQAAARSCYSIWAEADPMGSHYRHTVYVENDCEYWLQCSLWTDADPQPPQMVTVGPGMTEHAETNGSSEFDSPKAFGACHRK